ncbi:MAG: class F420-dependent oxidoreductase [Sphingomonadales bacterium]|jgi:alkanesulfonate monooxygenase SsuD/methylene tetrahydromethanopterin reductase-like flavin-dependent oxidoreductase (luciferase family)|nr:class F420-dependent oxidoreductase [Sphingomonadales bacterium]
MRLGLALPQMGPFVTNDVVREFATRADQLGYDSLWAQDHLFYPLQPIDELGLPGGLWPAPYRHLMAPLELLSYVAAITRRIDIGTSILVSAYHRPVALAKQAATIDLLSNGRFILGLGLGWSKAEYKLMETPYEKRGDRSSDFFRALRECLGPNPVEYDGTFFQVPISETSPKPTGLGIDGTPRLRLLGGFWSEPGMRRTAEFCDYWVAGPHSIADAAIAGQEVNRMAREDFGRGPVKTILRVMASPSLPGVITLDSAPVAIPMQYWRGSVEDMLPQLLEAKVAGIDEITLDVNYFEGLPGPASWTCQPDFFEPLLRAAHA